MLLDMCIQVRDMLVQCACQRLLSKLQEGLRLVLNGCMETCRFKRCFELLFENWEGGKCPMHGTEENPVYIM
jgi:hypothetical protein